jgi:hypothetical protein
VRGECVRVWVLYLHPQQERTLPLVCGPLILRTRCAPPVRGRLTRSPYESIASIFPHSPYIKGYHHFAAIRGSPVLITHIPPFDPYQTQFWYISSTLCETHTYINIHTGVWTIVTILYSGIDMSKPTQPQRPTSQSQVKQGASANGAVFFP